MQFTETGLAMTGGTIAMDATSNLNLTGGSINLNGGVFTIGSGNFNIDAQGNVTIKGNVTATEGTIGGWKVNQYSLYSGSGTRRVALTTDTSDYAIWAGDETASSAPFRVGKNGSLYASNAEITGTITSTNADITGKITASSGAIGGWTIGTDSLYAGSGTNRVALSTGNSTYAIWAGNETAANAPFRVTKDGKVYLTRVMALANEGDTTPTEVNLSNVSFWRIDSAWKRAVKSMSVANNTLTITLNDNTTVNFKKAAIGSLVGSGGGTDNFTVSYIEGYMGPGTGTVIKSGNVKMKLNSEIYNASSSVTASFDGTAYATLPVGDVYTQGKTDGANNIKNSITLTSTGWQTGGRNIVASNYGQSYTVELPAFSTSGGTSFTNNKTTVYFTTSSVNVPLKTVEVDASSVYEAGYNAGSGTGYNTGYAAGKEAYKPTIINRTSYDTDAKTVTVRALNSHQDLLTGVAIDASEIYEAGWAAAVAKIARDGNIIKGPSSTVDQQADLFTITAGGSLNNITNTQRNYFNVNGHAYAYINGTNVASKFISKSTNINVGQ